MPSERQIQVHQLLLFIFLVGVTVNIPIYKFGETCQTIITKGKR
jgi:hypothetical protein